MGRLATSAAIVLAATACSASHAAQPPPAHVRPTVHVLAGRVSVSGPWRGAEARAFRAVIARFRKSYPSLTVTYAAMRRREADLIVVSRPAALARLVHGRALRPLDTLRPALSAYPSQWLAAASLGRHLYALPLRVDDTSLLWYNATAFRDAALAAPTSWNELVSDAATLHASGIDAYAIPAADRHALLDLFANVYVRQAGTQRYTQLVAGSLSWTDGSVKRALSTLAQVLGDTGNVSGAVSRSLHLQIPGAVRAVFGRPARAALLFGSERVAARSSRTVAVAPFPSVDGGGGSDLVGAADLIAARRDSPSVRAFLTYLASPAAAATWPRRPDVVSPTVALPPPSGSRSAQGTPSAAVANSSTFVWDPEHELPPRFVRRAARILRRFFAGTTTARATAAALERAARATGAR